MAAESRRRCLPSRIVPPALCGRHSAGQRVRLEHQRRVTAGGDGVLERAGRHRVVLGEIAGERDAKHTVPSSGCGDSFMPEADRGA